MKFYEFVTFDTVIGGPAKVGPALRQYTQAEDASGKLLGAWAADTGKLNRVFMLREFDSRDALLDEREKVRKSDDPFGCAEFVTDIAIDSYAPLDFLPPVETGSFGPAYEIRTYILKPNGLVPTQDKWREAMPARSKYSPLTIAMYSLDGTPRFTHIWPYKSVGERQEIRAKTVADGIWPPKGGPDWLTPDMTSTIAFPLDFSPLK